MKSDVLKEKFGLLPSSSALQKCEKFIELFKEYNSHTNLMSKNDLSVIFEKHIVDSLSVFMFKEFQNCEIILDIGTGGGFPAVPISIFSEDKQVFAVDSIRKKIRFIESAKEELSLKNLTPLCSRIESLGKDYFKKFDLVVSRALGDLEKLTKYSAPYLKKGGYLCAYKSKSAKEELTTAEKVIKKSGFEYVESIPYEINLKENFERVLVLLRRA
ncbi:16S rRNA (guanine(527)-N(7))-methyltransferase RsmG [bacterium]|nr:16S rRNA (guanine(527)-N(7))-methyltransferase RsmG [bacterium]